MFSKVGKATMIAFAMAGLVVGCAKSNNLVKGRQATRSVPTKPANTGGTKTPVNPTGTNPAPATPVNGATPTTPPAAGNGATTPPAVTPNPTTPPADALYASITAGQSFIQGLAQQADATYETAICAQIVTSNGYNQVWVGPGQCPTDGSGNQTLQDWNAVYGTFFFESPDANSNMAIWDPMNPTIILGSLYQDISATNPSQAYILNDLCTGTFVMSADGTQGCTLQFTGAQVTGISEGLAD